jgi:hypothetical protein
MSDLEHLLRAFRTPGVVVLGDLVADVQAEIERRRLDPERRLVRARKS